ncbi:MAG: 50S ribosomal protein L25 [Actinobacteria bacterium]|nr:MAG: 50S ribosomal protein L25 [Actinomycetota bacterium]
MSAEAATIKAARRTVIGKASRRLKGAGLIPAVLYGRGRETVSISLDRHDFEQFLAHGAGHTPILRIEVEGEAKPVDAVIKSIHRDPTKDTVRHVDFLAVSMDRPIHASVTIHFSEECAGVKAGGVFTANLHGVEVEALPKDLPEAIEADISALEVGDNLHVSALIVPAGVTVLTDPDSVVCSVVAPRVEVEEAAPVEEAAEPEVIGEKSEEEE